MMLGRFRPFLWGFGHFSGGELFLTSGRVTPSFGITPWHMGSWGLNSISPVGWPNWYINKPLLLGWWVYPPTIWKSLEFRSDRTYGKLGEKNMCLTNLPFSQSPASDLSSPSLSSKSYSKMSATTGGECQDGDSAFDQKKTNKNQWFGTF